MSEAKRALLRIRRYDERIHRMMERQQQDMDAATRSTPVLCDTPPARGAGNADRIGNAATRMADASRRLARLMRRRAALAREVRSVLHRLESPKHARVLELRYLQHSTWKEAAEAMHRRVNTVIKLHGRALQAYEKAMKESQNE